MMSKDILSEANVKLGVSLQSQEEAIRYTGQILVDQGYVAEAYINKMLAREEVTSTYMGNYVAIPHGTDDAKDEVSATGISVVTVPEGVYFGSDNLVKVLIGIAGKGDEHLDVLSQIALVCSEEENIEKLVNAADASDILALFSEVN